MASMFHRKDLREELKILCNEGNKVAAGSVLEDKVAGKALVMSASASSIAWPPLSIVATKPLAPRPREPTIFDELARHKKR